MSRKMEYSLMVLDAMSGLDQLVTVKEMSVQLNSPFDVTAKVMQRMSKIDLIHSEQGVGGGYRLGRSLDQTSLHDLMEVITGPEGIVRCATDECDLMNYCKIKEPLLRLNTKLTALYESISLAELLAKDPLKPSHMTSKLESLKKAGLSL